jgi:hypothetical protein
MTTRITRSVFLSLSAAVMSLFRLRLRPWLIATGTSLQRLRRSRVHAAMVVRREGLVAGPLRGGAVGLVRRVVRVLSRG